MSTVINHNWQVGTGENHVAPRADNGAYEAGRSIDDQKEVEVFRWTRFLFQFGMHLAWPMSTVALVFAKHGEVRQQVSNQWTSFSRMDDEYFRERMQTASPCSWRNPNCLSMCFEKLTKRPYVVTKGLCMSLAVVAIVIVFAMVDLEYLTSSEVSLMVLVHVLRILMVACKYGYMSDADYKMVQRCTHQPTVRQIMFKEMLVSGWLMPSRSAIPLCVSPALARMARSSSAQFTRPPRMAIHQHRVL